VGNMSIGLPTRVVATALCLDGSFSWVTAADACRCIAATLVYSARCREPAAAAGRDLRFLLDLRIWKHIGESA